MHSPRHKQVQNGSQRHHISPEPVPLRRHRRRPRKIRTSNPARMTYPTADADADSDSAPRRQTRTDQPGTGLEHQTLNVMLLSLE